MRRRLFAILLAGSLMTSSTWCLAGEGTTGADFLRLVPGARAAALAGSYSALGLDAESMFANPAGILGLLNPQVGVSHLSWWEGITYDALWGVQPLGEAGAIGLSAAWLNVAPFNSTEDPAAPAGQAWNILCGGSYAYKFGRSLACGAQLKALLSRLGDSQSWGVALDAGAQYFLSNDQLVFSGVVREVGIMAPFQAVADPLPLAGIVGLGYLLWPDEPWRLSLSAESVFSPAGKPAFSLGVEGWAENFLALRAGVKSDQDSGDWLTLGAGLRWQGVHLDYALTPLGGMGLVHRFSLAYDFGSQRRLARPKLKVVMSVREFVYPDGDPGYNVQLVPTAVVASGLDHWDALIQETATKRVVYRASGEKQLPMALTWKGVDEAGKRVNVEGYYLYQMRVVDQQGYVAKVEGEILPISITALPKLKASPRDIFAGQVTFRPKTSEDLQEWSIEIVDANGRVLKRYLGQGTIPKDFAWDGTDEKQRQVAVKTGYHFVLKVRDRQNNEMRSASPLIVIDAGTKAFTDQPATLDEQVPFHFEPTDIKIKRWVFNILDTGSGKIVRTYEGTAPLPETLVWDSKDEQGRRVSSREQYSYVLQMQDSLGNVWQQAAPIHATAVRVLTSAGAGPALKVEEILFDFNQAELKTAVFEKLRKIADLVRSHSGKGVQVMIEGHTDEIGTDAYNKELSLKRAKMVMRYLVEDEALPSSLMQTQGYGKSRLIYTGDAPDKRAKNRRVEVTLFLPGEQ
ncbi:MAG: PorV/PorQ family protein [candidate division FCPU426 bacterium]